MGTGLILNRVGVYSIAPTMKEREEQRGGDACTPAHTIVVHAF